MLTTPWPRKGGRTQRLVLSTNERRSSQSVSPVTLARQSRARRGNNTRASLEATNPADCTARFTCLGCQHCRLQTRGSLHLRQAQRNDTHGGPRTRSWEAAWEASRPQGVLTCGKMLVEIETNTLHPLKKLSIPKALQRHAKIKGLLGHRAPGLPDRYSSAVMS